MTGFVESLGRAIAAGNRIVYVNPNDYARLRETIGECPQPAAPLAAFMGVELRTRALIPVGVVVGNDRKVYAAERLAA